jgi:hypothetical protein
MALDNDQYRELFIEEAKEHIETLTKSMLILEKDPENRGRRQHAFPFSAYPKRLLGYDGFQGLPRTHPCHGRRL